jgi:hypothetical protein
LSFFICSSSWEQVLLWGPLLFCLRHGSGMVHGAFLPVFHWVVGLIAFVSRFGVLP